jgi:arylsulfate sulfotransferase
MSLNAEHCCQRLSFATATLFVLLASGCGAPPTKPYIEQTSNPLVAQYDIPVQGPAQTWVEFGPDTKYGRQTSQVSTDSGSSIVTILVAGMQPSAVYHMRAHTNFADGNTWVDQDRTFKTGPLPDPKTQSGSATNGPLQATGTIQVVTPDVAGGSTPAPGVELLSLNPPANVQQLAVVATDLKGNVIWFCPQTASPAKLMPNGHFMLNTGTDLLEVDLACNVIRDVSVDHVNQLLQAGGYDFTIPPNLGLPGGSPFHHDMLFLPNGHWIALCQIAKSFDNLQGYSGTTKVAGDALVDIDPQGDVVWAWSAFDHLDVNRHPYFPLPDWTHGNALVYTPDGNLLLSMRAQSWILKIDYRNGTGSGDILWRLGEGGDFTITGGNPSQWFYAQHYPNLLSTNGSLMTLAVYDDGNFRVDSNGVQCQSSATAPACYTRATIFQVDESTSVATLLWQDLPGFFNFWGGSIGILSNGDVEFANSANNPSDSTASSILEVTHTTNPQVVWQMNITGENAYRGYRMPSLYPGVTWTK